MMTTTARLWMSLMVIKIPLAPLLISRNWSGTISLSWWTPLLIFMIQSIPRSKRARISILTGLIALSKCLHPQSILKSLLAQTSIATALNLVLGSALRSIAIALISPALLLSISMTSQCSPLTSIKLQWTSSLSRDPNLIKWWQPTSKMATGAQSSLWLLLLLSLAQMPKLRPALGFANKLMLFSARLNQPPPSLVFLTPKTLWWLTLPLHPTKWMNGAT